MEKNEFDKIFAAVKAEVAQRLTAAPGCHDMDHTLRVLHNAQLLLDELPEADKEVVRLAALLHDVARPEEIRRKGRKCHAALGAVTARKILLENGVPDDIAANISECVRTHRYRSGEAPETLEAEIVYDADKLDSLGAVGIGRAFLFAGREGAKLHNNAGTALNSEPYSIEDTAYREYLIKLRRLPDAMRTGPGRRIGGERLAFMRNFFDQLNLETEMR